MMGSRLVFLLLTILFSGAVRGENASHSKPAATGGASSRLPPGTAKPAGRAVLPLAQGKDAGDSGQGEGKDPADVSPIQTPRLPLEKTQQGFYEKFAFVLNANMSLRNDETFQREYETKRGEKYRLQCKAGKGGVHLTEGTTLRAELPPRLKRVYDSPSDKFYGEFFIVSDTNPVQKLPCELHIEMPIDIPMSSAYIRVFAELLNGKLTEASRHEFPDAKGVELLAQSLANRFLDEGLDIADFRELVKGGDRADAALLKLSIEGRRPLAEWLRTKGIEAPKSGLKWTARYSFD